MILLTQNTDLVKFKKISEVDSCFRIGFAKQNAKSFKQIRFILTILANQSYAIDKQK